MSQAGLVRGLELVHQHACRVLDVLALEDGLGRGQDRSEGHLGGILARFGTALEAQIIVFPCMFQRVFGKRHI